MEKFERKYFHIVEWKHILRFSLWAELLLGSGGGEMKALNKEINEECFKKVFLNN